MQVQVNTDHNIEGHEALAARVNGVVVDALGRFSSHITRVEVHLSDEDSNKKHGADQIRCVMEARLERHPPVAATQQASNVVKAVDGAAAKLGRLLEHTLGRLQDHRTRRIDPPLSEPGLPTG